MGTMIALDSRNLRVVVFINNEGAVYCTFGVGNGDKFFNSPFAPMDVTNPKGTPRRPRTRTYTAPNRLRVSENG